MGGVLPASAAATGRESQLLEASAAGEGNSLLPSSGHVSPRGPYRAVEIQEGKETVLRDSTDTRPRYLSARRRHQRAARICLGLSTAGIVAVGLSVPAWPAKGSDRAWAWLPNLLRRLAIGEGASLGGVSAGARGMRSSAEVKESSCHTAIAGERCHSSVAWAMDAGLDQHPEWYPGLNVSSTFEDFQALLHTRRILACPRPCPRAIRRMSPPPLSPRAHSSTQAPLPEAAGEEPHDSSTTVMVVDAAPSSTTLLTTDAADTLAFRDALKKLIPAEKELTLADMEHRSPDKAVVVPSKSSTTLMVTDAASNSTTRLAPTSTPELTSSAVPPKSSSKLMMTVTPDTTLTKTSRTTLTTTLRTTLTSSLRTTLTTTSRTTLTSTLRTTLTTTLRTTLTTTSRTITSRTTLTTTSRTLEVDDAEADADQTKRDTCHTAVEGEVCYRKVRWAMTDGIFLKPAWYPGLTSESSFEAFQVVLHRLPEKWCPKPCMPCTDDGEDCRDSLCCTRGGSRCFEKGKYWASCRESCTPGVDPNDMDGKPWSCRPLGPVAVSPTTTTTTRTWGSPSFFCWSVMRPDGYEPELMRVQAERGAGIFACDEYAVLCSAKGNLSGGVEYVTFQPATVGLSKDGTAGNTLLFLHAWEAIRKDGRYEHHDFTVKVDPDAVLIPERLRGRLLEHAGSNIYVRNCNLYPDNPDFPMMFGSLEVLSRHALKSYFMGADTCRSQLKWQTWGEDLFMGKCLLLLGVQPIDDYKLIGDAVCTGAICGQHGVAAFHPFKTVEGWLNCWRVVGNLGR